MNLIRRLEAKAMASINGNETVVASERGITVKYYPVCGRFRWFNRSGAINRSNVNELADRDHRLPVGVDSSPPKASA